MMTLLGRILGHVIAFSLFTVPRGIIKGYKSILGIIDKHFKVTALMIRTFLAELLLVEGLFEVLPLFIGEGIYKNKGLVSLYNLITCYQWDKSMCTRIEEYLANNLVSDLSRLEPAVFVAMLIFSIGIIMLSVIALSLVLNIKYIVIFAIIDMVINTVKIAGKVRNITIEKADKTFKDAGYLPL